MSGGNGTDAPTIPLRTHIPDDDSVVSSTSSQRSSPVSETFSDVELPPPIKLKTSATYFDRVTKPESTLQLSFFDRYFKKPAAPPTETKSLQSSADTILEKQRAPPTPSYKTEHRRFSFKSKGSLTTIACLIITVLILLASLLGYFLSRRKPVTFEAVTPASIDDNAVAYSHSTPPIRLGLLTNFPDPTIRYDASSKTWYAIGTNYDAGIAHEEGATPNPATDNNFNLQLATSTDFSTWNLYGTDILPNPGNWTRNGTTKGPLPGKLGSLDSTSGKDDAEGKKKGYAKANVWAPELLQHPTSGKWLLYYTAAADLELMLGADDAKKHHKGGTHCISVATSDSPTGPFTPADMPLVCPIYDGGAIDPSIYVNGTNNEIWMAYKIDGNSLGHGGECGNTVEPIQQTPIMLQKMSADGLSLDKTYEPKQLLDRTADDGPLIEAPSLIKNGETFYLFFSSGCTRSPSYDVKYATASSIEGPYTRADGTLLKTGDHELLAPGSVTVTWQTQSSNAKSVITDDMENQAAKNDSSGRWKIALHGRVDQPEGGVRAMFTSGLTFDNDKLTITLVDGVGGSNTTSGGSHDDMLLS